MTTLSPEATAGAAPAFANPPPQDGDELGDAFWTEPTTDAAVTDALAEAEANLPAPASDHGTVICRECNGEFRSLARHLATHDMTAEQYQTKHPGARIVAEGVHVGRRKKDAPTSGGTTDDPQVELLASASGIELVELDRLARDGFTELDKAVQDALLGKTDGARTTYALAYEFSRRCIGDPASAEALPRWAEAKVQAGANLYYRPLKYLTLDVLSRDLTSALTQWAAVFQDANARDLNAEAFADELRRRGRRPWYNDLRKTKGGTGEGKTTKGKRRQQTVDVKAGTPADSAHGATETLSAAEGKELLKQYGFSDPSQPTGGGEANPERMDAKAAAALLAEQGAQIEPDRWTQEEARKHFAPAQVLILWEADKLSNVLATLKAIDGFVRVLGFDGEAVKKIVGNDR